MKTKEITIYDNYYCYEREKEIREFLFEEYAEEYGWKSPEDIPDNRVWDEIDFQDREAWHDVKDELQTMLSKNVYLLTGTCGRWNGTVSGGKFIRSVNDLLSCISHLDYIRDRKSVV